MLKPYNKGELEFELLSEIGSEGSNSRAFLAHDKQLDANIVIKKILKSVVDSALYFEESKILYLSSHPNVVPVYYSCQDKDSIYIAMPYFSKGSLNAQMAARFHTVREIVVVGCQIATGLHNIHSKRLVHFDIKPDNVLMSDRGEALISDFGLSKRLSTGGLADQDSFYQRMRPPEAFSANQFDSRFDIYQLGLTLYRMCNGNDAFNRQFAAFGTHAKFDRNAFRVAVVNGQFPERTLFPEHVPANLKKVIQKCLKTDPLERFSSAIDVTNALAAVEDRLDWRYSVSATGRNWVRTDDDRILSLSIDALGNAIATKEIRASGNKTRISKYCKVLNNPEIQKFLGNE